MNAELTESVVATIRDAASKLTGWKRRAFQAQVTLDYLQGNARRAECVFGWGRDAVELGLNKLRTGIICQDNFAARGNKKTEVKHPELERDIRSLAEPQSQQDPKFQSSFLYTRMTAAAMREALIKQKGWTDEELPHVNTIREILNRLGFKLRRVQKAKPLSNSTMNQLQKSIPHLLPQFILPDSSPTLLSPVMAGTALNCFETSTTGRSHWEQLLGLNYCQQLVRRSLGWACLPRSWRHLRILRQLAASSSR